MDQNKTIIGALIIVFIGIGIWAATGSNKDPFSGKNAEGVVKKEFLNDGKTPASEGTKTGENPVNNASAVPPAESEINKKLMNATMKTSLGEIKLEIYGDKTPITAANFVKLAETGFYNGVKFHRVIKGFMIQGGDPLTKDDSQKASWGTGGPGYQFADEKFTGDYSRGVLAMANAGPNTNGSQFFIMHQDYRLSPNYVIFGKVTAGMDTVDKIAELPVGDKDCPIIPPVIESITVEK
jgi:cyclophilin family peptidyl-prolyl cis-trans isomerase